MRILLVLWVSVWATAAFPQQDNLQIMTVTRPPFSMVENGTDTGFSIDLWTAVAEELDVTYQIQRVDGFSDMLFAIENGTADGAIANISVTASREATMDFSQPIYASGLQIMLPDDGRGTSIFSILFRPDLIFAVIGAFALLFGGGMVMWALERKHQEYFDRPANEAMFPSFWWALNLVVNGGFEQLASRSVFGRIFGTLMVVSSLFIVSIFVAKITATLTVDAITNNVSGMNDLYDKRVGTIQNSTAAGHMQSRDLRFTGFAGLEDMLTAFEAGDLDAVVFDAPILAYYANTRGKGSASLVGNVFLSENYAMALPSGSTLAEPVNRALLKLRENGRYDALLRKWFGASR